MRITAIAAVLAAAFMLTGCAASEQVYDKNYARAVAVTGKDGKAAIFAFYDEENKTFAASGDDLDDIRSKAELDLGKSVFTGHTELIVLGDCDYAATLEYMLNEWKVSPSCLVVYGGGYAAYVMKNYDAETLTDSVRHSIDQGKSPECDIVTVLSGLLSDEGAVNVAKVGKNGVEGEKLINNPS